MFYLRNNLKSGTFSLITIIVTTGLLCACSGGGGLVASMDGASFEAASEFSRAADNEPRSVSLEQAAVEINAVPVPADVDIGLFEEMRAELLRVIEEQQGSRIASSAPAGTNSGVRHLAPVESTRERIRFVWLERNSGDYNMDGEVNASDLTPLGQRYGQRLNDGSDDAWDRCIDGNGDGEIGMADITPIGLNYLKRVSGYNVYRKPRGDDAQFELAGTVTRDHAYFVPRAGWVYSFAETLPDDLAAAYTYQVRPICGTTEGKPSANLLVCPGSSHGMQSGDPTVFAVEHEGMTAYAKPDELLLGVGRSVEESELLNLVYGKLGGVLLGKLTGQDTYRVHFPPRSRGVGEVMRHYALQNPGYVMTYNYLDYKCGLQPAAKSVSKTYTDDIYGQQYGIQTVHAEAAWDLSEGDGVLIGVIDSGVNWEHEDLNGRIVASTRISPTEAEEIQGTEHEDFDGHGTAVTGVMVMNGGNTVGGVGIASNARVWMCKTGSYSIDGHGNFDWTFPHSQTIDALGVLTDEGVDVINMSLGGNIYNPFYQAAITNAIAADIVVVAACGNDNEDANYYPANYSGVLSVGAVDQSRDRWDHDPDSGSNFGSWVDICAPGVDIVSTTNAGGYLSFTGTSLAAPYVTAGIALVRSYYPSMGWASAAQLLVDTASWIPTDEDIGELLNLQAAMESGVDEQEIEVDPTYFLEVCDMEESGSVSFTIENSGDLNLTWSAMFYGTTTGLNVGLDDYSATTGGGDSQEIELTYTAPDYGGSFQTEVHISSNDSDEPVVVVQFNLYVTEPELEIDPLLLEMELDRGDRETGYITVSNTGSGVLRVEETHGGDYLSAGFSVLQLPGTPVEISAGHSEEIAVTIDTTLLIGGNLDGDYTGYVLVYSNDPDEPVTQIDVEYTIHDSTPNPYMEIDQSDINLTMEPGTTGMYSLEIGNSGTSDLDYTVAPACPFDLQVFPGGPIAPGDTFDLELVINAPETEGEYQGILDVMAFEFMPRSFQIEINLTVQASPEN